MSEVSKLALKVNNLLLSVLYQTAYYDSFLLTLLIPAALKHHFFIWREITFIILVIIIIAVVADTEKKIFHIMDSVDAK